MTAALICLVLVVALGGAWAFQMAGYAPCELCLRERIPYYLGIPVAAVAAFAARRRRTYLAVAGFAVLIVVFALSTAFGLYHVGVEWRFWPGPTECSGAVPAAANVADFLEQLHHVSVVRCDQPAITILGISLAGWNALVSVLVVGLANTCLLRIGAKTTA